MRRRARDARVRTRSLSLAAAIAATGPDAALVMDQAEELFSVCTTSARTSGVRSRHRGARRTPSVVHRASCGPHWRNDRAPASSCTSLRRACQLLGPMNDEELRAAIEQPARLVGVPARTGARRPPGPRRSRSTGRASPPLACPRRDVGATRSERADRCRIPRCGWRPRRGREDSRTAVSGPSGERASARARRAPTTRRDRGHRRCHTSSPADDGVDRGNRDQRTVVDALLEARLVTVGSGRARDLSRGPRAGVAAFATLVGGGSRGSTHSAAPLRCRGWLGTTRSRPIRALSRRSSARRTRMVTSKR